MRKFVGCLFKTFLDTGLSLISVKHKGPPQCKTLEVIFVHFAAEEFYWNLFAILQRLKIFD
jgi:hypothetical protein